MGAVYQASQRPCAITHHADPSIGGMGMRSTSVLPPPEQITGHDHGLGRSTVDTSSRPIRVRRKPMSGTTSAHQHPSTATSMRGHGARCSRRDRFVTAGPQRDPKGPPDCPSRRPNSNSYTPALEDRLLRKLKRIGAKRHSRASRKSDTLLHRFIEVCFCVLGSDDRSHISHHAAGHQRWRSLSPSPTYHRYLTSSNL